MAIDTADLEFLVRLSRVYHSGGWKGLRPGDRQNIRDELAGFFNAHPERSRVSGGPASDEEMAHLINHASIAVDHWAYRKDAEAEIHREAQAAAARGEKGFPHIGWSLTMPFSSLHVFLTSGKAGGLHTTVRGTLRDAFYWRLLEVLRAPEAERLLRLCPVCNLPFVRKRRAERCSRECTNRFWNAKALEKKDAKERRRRAARAAYEKRFPGKITPRKNGNRVRKAAG